MIGIVCGIIGIVFNVVIKKDEDDFSRVGKICGIVGIAVTTAFMIF